MLVGGGAHGVGTNAPPQVGGQNFFNDFNMLHHSVTQDVHGIKEFTQEH